MLSLEERFEYCKYCTKSKQIAYDKWLCTLTQKEPDFKWVCYDYDEQMPRTIERKMEISDTLEKFYFELDFDDLNWDELEPEKEVMFCPGEETIERGHYLNSEIVAVHLNDVRWWGIEKINGIDLSEKFKIIIKNHFYNFNAVKMALLAVLMFFVSIIVFYGILSLDGYVLYAIAVSVLTYLVGKVMDKMQGRPKYSCIEINRKEGFMKLPGDNMRYVVPFKNVHYHILGGGSPGGSMGLCLAMVKPPRNSVAWVPFFQRQFTDMPMEALSQMVWYMDKNRPLPPGREFDPFRQADFERRRAEGFPPPMYLSHIPTPEATAEQHAEREKYWKDEDYKVTDMTTRDVLINTLIDRGRDYTITYSHLQEGIKRKSYLGGAFSVKIKEKDKSENGE